MPACIMSSESIDSLAAAAQVTIKFPIGLLHSSSDLTPAHTVSSLF